MKVKTQRAVVLSILLTVAVCGQAFGLHRYIAPRHVRHASLRPTIHPRVRRSRSRRVAWNPVFRPSHDSLLRQNLEIDRMDLPRIQNDEELEQLKSSQDLVPIIAGRTLRFDPRLAPNRRYCRPWTRDFLGDISEAYYQQFHTSLQVNSAVRTVQVQKKLRRHNRNAAPETGETASSHLAGITVDIQRRGMTKAQVQWMEQYIMPLKDAGLVEPEEERHQWVFHVAVSGRYADFRESKIAKVEAPADDVSVPDSIPVPAANDLSVVDPQQ
ncbi:MAG TPA: DUF5715 family protein [Terriglobales bacterium]|nr:DUF5715 family protein [Terriglobales bacterium]